MLQADGGNLPLIQRYAKGGRLWQPVMDMLVEVIALAPPVVGGYKGGNCLGLVVRGKGSQRSSGARYQVMGTKKPFLGWWGGRPWGDMKWHYGGGGDEGKMGFGAEGGWKQEGFRVMGVTQAIKD